jgi:hypothetical protein
MEKKDGTPVIQMEGKDMWGRDRRFCGAIKSKIFREVVIPLVESCFKSRRF